MSPQPWRRAAVAALAASALVGGLAVAAPTALAQPADSSSSTEQTQAPISPDQVLMMISQEYQTGKGGGQVSKLIEQVMTLRMRGIRPSRGNAVALSAALEKRPNQVPLIQAASASTAPSNTRNVGVPSLTACRSVTQLGSIQSQRRSPGGMSG